MLSHTVPRKLLEHFAYDDPVTRSKRLWRYQKAQPPYGRATPKTATRWDGHFADPANAWKETEVEARLQREFEEPVNQFIDLIGYQTFAFTPTHIRLLAGYLMILFNRSRARREANVSQQQTLVDALRAFRADEGKLAQYVAKMTMDLVPGGLRRMITIDEAKQGIDNAIAQQTTTDAAQHRYVATMETMMAFDDGLRNGNWGILRAEPHKPFLIGDAPVVTWERTAQNMLLFGQGFARPDVEAFLPIFPTACLHVLPVVTRNRQVLTPTADEVNMAQAAFATYCFTNIQSEEIDALLRPYFGMVRLGIDGFSIEHLDHNQKLFDILMNPRGPRGRVDERQN
jgi:hypothetical protein